MTPDRSTARYVAWDTVAVLLAAVCVARALTGAGDGEVMAEIGALFLWVFAGLPVLFGVNT